RRRADVETAYRRRVGEARRPEEQLTEIVDAAADVPADQVRVMALDIGRPQDGSREHAIAEAWREPFDLLLDPRQHVLSRPVRHVAVGPRGLPICGRARRVEQRRLRDQDEGTFGDAAAPGVAFAEPDVLESAADVDRAGARTPLRAPWDPRVERPVHLEDAAA